MSELYGISNVDRREDVVRQYKAVHESVGATRPKDPNVDDGGNAGYAGDGGRRKARPKGNDSDGIGQGEHHDFDVTV